MEHLTGLIVELNIYILLVLSASLTIGMVNLLTLCQSAFYGIGAFIATFILMNFHVPILVILVAVTLTTGLFSFVLSYASFKLKGDYFVLATMGFQLIVYSILCTWESVTKGTAGIDEIPSARVLGMWELSGEWAHPILSLILVVAALFLFYWLHHSPFGRELRAIKADELTVQSLGRNTAAAKSWAFFISAAIAGAAGVVWASFTHHIQPEAFDLSKSILIVVALFIGGIGSIEGSVIGAMLIVLLPELLKMIGFPESVAAPLHEAAYGLALILIVFFFPHGIAGKTKFK